MGTVKTKALPQKIRRHRTLPPTRSAPYLLENLEHRLFLTATPTAQSQAIESLNLAAAVFVQNQGQWPDASIKYAYNGQGINVGFTNTGPVLQLLQSETPTNSIQQQQIAVSFDNAQSTAPTGIDQSPASFNYLAGEATQHRTNVPAYQKISYPSLYKGIDLLTWAQPQGMKYEFHVAPHANWKNIRVTYTGSTGLTLAPDGSLHIATSLGDLVEQAPVLYQTINGTRVQVAGQFILIDADTYAFAITGKYDPSRELIIDPDLAWTKTFGGTASDQGWGLDIDPAGNIYVTGQTSSTGWATPGAYQETYNHSADIFIAKLSGSDGSLLYATYLGGSAQDISRSIAVDSAGNAYITGYTSSSGWATPGAFDESYNGGEDVFVAKIDPTGSSLLYATYLGGTGDDEAYGIDIDADGNAYTTGQTNSAGWATPNVYDSTFKISSSFIAKLDPPGSSLLYATYLGGSTVGNGIAVDSAGIAYVVGNSDAKGLATTGAYDTTQGGQTDAFIAKLSADGSSLLAATYFGGKFNDFGRGIALDINGNIYITGTTGSSGLATPGAYDTTYNSTSETVYDIFVAKFNTALSSLTYMTYLGGNSYDYGYSIAVDAVGNAFVTGATASANWATPGAYDTINSPLEKDGYLAKLNPSGSSLLYATYLGGSGSDFNWGIKLDATGNAYMAGYGGRIGSEDVLLLKFTGIVDLFPGDTNNDGKVDFADLVAVAQNYGGTSKTRSQGDVTGDGNVDFADLVLIAQNYGTSLAAAAVPQPSAPAQLPRTQPTTKPLATIARPFLVKKPVPEKSIATQSSS